MFFSALYLQTFYIPNIILVYTQIVELPSKLFYNNKLICKAVLSMTGPKDIPAIKFIAVDGREMLDEDSPSYYNIHESIKIAEQVHYVAEKERPFYTRK